MAAQDDGPVETPCPDCTPKPFARAVPYKWQAPEGWGTHAVEFDTPEGDRLVWPGPEAYATASAARLTAAVEAREAKLREALIEAIDGLGVALGTVDPETSPMAYGEIHDAQSAVRAAIEDRYDAVSGDVACGLAFDQGMWQALVRDLQVVVDALSDDNPTERAVIGPFLEAMGLRKRGLEAYSDEQLAAEEKRRLAIEWRVHVFAEHEYGFADGHHTVTGRSLCGMDLQVGGRWTAITRNDFESGSRADCAGCLTAAKLRDAALAMTQPA